jgi:hypothetical protein
MDIKPDHIKIISHLAPHGIIGGINVIHQFGKICDFLKDNPDSLSWAGKIKPSPSDEEGMAQLARKFIGGHMKSDFPAIPGTVPDEMVSIVMQVAYGYTTIETERIKKEHQHSMCAENCVGALLERYLNSVLHNSGWVWCCGDFIKAVDFIFKKPDGWEALQIKNRDNSENSSSSAIRNNTSIQKWFRTFSRTGATNWDNLPPAMQGKGLSEEGFIQFVRSYLSNARRTRSE